MGPKEYFQQGFKLNERIKSKLEQVEELRAMAEKTTQVISDMPKGPSPGSRMEDLVIKIADLTAEIAKDASKLVDLKAEMITVIHSIPDTGAQLVLEQRYLLYKDWKSISDATGYDERTLYRIHGKALLAAEPAIKNLENT